MKSFVQILKNSVWTGGMSIITAIGGFLISIVIARVLGPEGKGTYAFVVIIMTTTAFLCNPSLYTAGNYFFSNNRFDKSSVFRAILIAGIGSAVLAFISASIAALFLVDDLSFLEIMLIGLGSAAVSLSSTTNGSLYGQKKIRFVTLWMSYSAIGQTALIVYAGIFTDLGLSGFIVLFICFQVLDAIAKTFVTGKGVWKLIFQKPIPFRPVLRFGFSVYLGRVLLMLSQRIDTYLVYLLRGSESLGYYSISATFAEQLWLLPIAVNLVLLTNINSTSDFEKQRTTTYTSQVVTAVALFAAIILGSLSYFFIPLIYGEAFRPAITPLIITLPGAVACSTYFILEPFFQSRDKPQIPVKISFWGALSNMVFSLVLIRLFGIVGAAVAYSTSYFFQLVLALHQFSKMNNTRFWQPVNIFETGKLGIQAARSYHRNMKMGHSDV
jgi:O-antigen/teichoic acid export membrane protein